MRNEDDINTAHDLKSIFRGALLNDNAPDSDFYRTRVQVTGEQQVLTSTFSSELWTSTFSRRKYLYKLENMQENGKE